MPFPQTQGLNRFQAQIKVQTFSDLYVKRYGMTHRAGGKVGKAAFKRVLRHRIMSLNIIRNTLVLIQWLQLH